jgi:NADPH2:quinone reductase
MRAARYATSGPRAGEIEIVDLPVPEPREGEVLVRVRFSGVNPTDWKSRVGGGLTTGGLDEIVPNQDGAGEIERVGPAVDAGRVGERVWLYECQWQRAHGSAAQWIALPERQAVRLPDAISHEHGAGIGIPAMTAHRTLFAHGPLDGARVLVQGGAGAVGHAAIQLAVRGGARVAATVSSEEKAQLARDAGAELVVNYREEDVVETVRAWGPVDRVVEVAIAANLETDGAVLAPSGAIASYGAPDGPLPPNRDLIVKNASIHLVLVYTMPDEAKRRAVVDITSALEEGALRPLPIARYALEETQAAHEAVEGGFVGKVIIDVP